MLTSPRNLKGVAVEAKTNGALVGTSQDDCDTQHHVVSSLQEGRGEGEGGLLAL